MPDQFKFDVSLKELIEFDPQAWLEFVGVREPLHELIDADLSTVTAQADKVFKIGGERPYLVHIEVQASRDPSMGLRLARYNLLLNYRHDVPTRSVLILLRREADDGTLSGTYETSVPGRPTHMIFRYDVIRLWETPPEALLNAGLGLIPLAPLGRVDASTLPHILRLIDEQVAKIAKPRHLGVLRAATTILMSLKFTKEQIMGALSGDGFEEHWLYKEIFAKGEERGIHKGYQAGIEKGIERGIEKGIEKGLEKGLEQGLLQGERHALIIGLAKACEVLWGRPSPEIMAKLEEISSKDILERLYPRIHRVNSWSELVRVNPPEPRE